MKEKPHPRSVRSQLRNNPLKGTPLKEIRAHPISAQEPRVLRHSQRNGPMAARFAERLSIRLQQTVVVVVRGPYKNRIFTGSLRN
jgi:hypothetical protein